MKIFGVLAAGVVLALAGCSTGDRDSATSASGSNSSSQATPSPAAAVPSTTAAAKGQQYKTVDNLCDGLDVSALGTAVPGSATPQTDNTRELANDECDLKLAADPPGYHLLTVVAGVSSSGVSQQHNYQQSSGQATNPTPVLGLGTEAYYASNDTTQQVVLWDVNLILVVKYTQVVGTPPTDLQRRLAEVAQGVRAKLLA
jgi:hypothetical protein